MVWMEGGHEREQIRRTDGSMIYIFTDDEKVYIVLG